MFSLIVAFDQNQLIGNGNKMPWHLPEDLKYFKQKTMNHKVVMGYNTYQSILSYLGKPFPNRDNIILTYDDFSCDFSNVDKCLSIPDFLEKYRDLDEEIFIAGGKSIYEQMIKYCDRLYITHIDKEYEGDTYFPEFDYSEFNLVSENKDGILNFCVYERKANV